jgi:predicted ABC-type sugar transport system permease subunit
MSATTAKPHAAGQTYRAVARFGLPLLVVAIGVREPHFLSVANAQNLARQLAPLQIVVIGQLFALLRGGLDLSVASVMACSGVVGILALPHVGLAGALVIMIVTVLLFGLANGANHRRVFRLAVYRDARHAVGCQRRVAFAHRRLTPVRRARATSRCPWLWRGLWRTDIEPRVICGNAGRRPRPAQDDLRPPCLRNRL